MLSMRSTWKVVAIILVVFAIVAAGCMPLQRGAMQPGGPMGQQAGVRTGMGNGMGGRTAGAGMGMGGRFADVTAVDGNGFTRMNAPLMQTTIANLPVGALTDAEKAGLLFMREEEKLAHDVYVTLSEKWGAPVFQNIPKSEQTHTDAIKFLIDRYSLTDPAIGKAVGVFADESLQKLYNQLVEKGNQSLANALTVGATVEDLDIADLQTRLAQTDKADIQMVYQNLMKGSRNHLRAFTQSLTSQAGAAYTPQYLSQAAFDSIVKAPMERGPAR
ncbi:MAG: DUF2202 domain-containing protein [Caldilineaceae bacterium]